MPGEDDIPPTDPVEPLVRMLTPEERMLVVLKRELYDDDWQAMTDDLSSRLAGGPYVFKLANRIEDDLQRIERLRALEAEHSANLADYVDP